MKYDAVAVNLDGGTPGAVAYANTLKALQLLEEDGQLDRMKLGGTVLVKPNLTQPPNPSLKFGPRESDLTCHNHVCTDPFAVKAACDFVTGHGGRPLVAEGTKWPGGTRGAFLQMGCEALLEGSGAVLVDTLTGSPGERMALRPARAWNRDYREIEVSRLFEGIDVLLNLAKMKTHSNALVTGAVKNMYGALEPASRRAAGHYCADPLWARTSRRNMAQGYKLLSEVFVQVHSAILHGLRLPEIAVVEGVVAGEGDGPLYQPATPRRENIVLASTGPATADAAESFYIGYNPAFLRGYAEYTLRNMGYEADAKFLDSYAEQYFLKLATEAGLGRTGGFSVYAVTPRATEVIPCEMLSLLRRGDVFALPTFVRFAANTPLFERVPDGDREFAIGASA